MTKTPRKWEMRGVSCILWHDFLYVLHKTKSSKLGSTPVFFVKKMA